MPGESSSLGKTPCQEDTDRCSPLVLRAQNPGECTQDRSQRPMGEPRAQEFHRSRIEREQAGGSTSILQLGWEAEQQKLCINQGTHKQYGRLSLMRESLPG